MHDQAPGHRLDGQVRDRRTGVDRGVEGGAIVFALVSAHQDQRARGVGVAVAAPQQAGHRGEASASPRCPDHEPHRLPMPPGRGPASRLQEGDQLLGRDHRFGVEGPRTPPAAIGGWIGTWVRARRSAGGQRVGQARPRRYRRSGREKQVLRPLILRADIPHFRKGRQWRSSCRSTADPRWPTPTGSGASPSASSKPRRPATTSSSSSPRWVTPPTNCWTWPSRSARRRPPVNWTCC